MSIATVVMQILSRGTLDGTFAWEAILDEDTQNQDFFPGEFLCTPRNEGSLYVSAKLPTYPPPPQTNINTYFSLREKGWLRGGIGGQFPSKMTSLPGRLSKEIKPAGDLFTARAKEWMKKARERKKGKSFWRESMHKSLNVLRIKSNVYF